MKLETCSSARSSRAFIFTLLAVSAGLAHIAATASAEPAVDGVNGKLTAFGGAHGDGENDDGIGGLAGNLTLPIGLAFGAQFDGAWARVGDEDFANTGLHLFWRDPGKGLLGLYGGYAHLTDEGGQDVGRIGAEAQYFAGKLTFDAAAGVRFGDIDAEGYVRAKLDYYLTDDFKVSAGYVFEGDSFGLAAGEYQMTTGSGVGASLFADARINDEDTYTVLGGVKLYFGKPMSLIDRHRKQDPDGYTDLDLIAAQQAAAAARKNQSTPGSSAPAVCSATFVDECDKKGFCESEFTPDADIIACDCASLNPELICGPPV